MARAVLALGVVRAHQLRGRPPCPTISISRPAISRGLVEHRPDHGQRRLDQRAEHRRLSRRRERDHVTNADAQTVTGDGDRWRGRRQCQPDQPNAFNTRRRGRIRTSPIRPWRCRARAPAARPTSFSISMRPGARTSPSASTRATSTAASTTRCSRSPSSIASAAAAWINFPAGYIADATTGPASRRR